MDDGRGTGSDGCASRLLAGAGLVWLGTAPLVSRFVVDAVLGALLGSQTVDCVAALLTGLVTVVPLALTARTVRRRGGGERPAAYITSLAIAGGYVALDAAILTTLPPREALVPLTSRYLVTALRLLLLLPYALAAARYGPQVAGLPNRPLTASLGWVRASWSTFWLSLAAAALLTLPWPLTGALGDSLTSLAVSLQTLSSVLSQVLIFWGTIFLLLTATSPRTEAAAAATVLVYGVAVLGSGLARGVGGAVSNALFLLPLALLLTEMRARGGNALVLGALASCYRLGPTLFVDPRDVIAMGLPELQHLLSYGLVVLTAPLLALLLWLARRAWVGRNEAEPGCAAAPTVFAVAGLAAWGLWIGLYAVAGEPGFFNDGFLIILEEQSQLEQVYGVEVRQDRVRTVYDTLVETAEASQASIRAELEELGVPYRPYYIVNMVRVDGHRWLMDRFRGREGVAEVLVNPNVRKYPWRVPLPYGSGGESGVLPPNLAAIHADVAWDREVLGQGIVVGGQDTGYDWDHPALRSQYRGWDGEQADHDYHWHDAWDETVEPLDDGSHGTHTMGTVLGDDGGGNRIGVAPRATWIGCRNMRRGIGNPGSYAECMEFLLAPYPLGGDPLVDGEPSLAAHVTNNSWGCPPVEGCHAETLRPAIEALRAAGIMVVVSAGNDGPACGTAADPPARYDASFTVGATTDAGRVVGFSSRGPADGLIKPDIVAPGQLVRSSLAGGEYGTAAGTSMAAPHVAGTIALIWSADPGLIGDVEATEALLCRTASSKPVTQSCQDASVPGGPLGAAGTPQACACGGVRGTPNNAYGCGLLDAGAAVRAVLGD